MTLAGPLAWYTLASTLLEAVRVRLADTAAGAPERVCVVPGAQADDECDCGALTVAVGRTYYSEVPPTETAGGGPCEQPYLAADLTVRVVRCAPGPDQRGNGPSCEALDAAAQTVEIDAYATRLAVVCRLQELAADNEIDGFLVRAQPREGPSGGCVGSQLDVTVWLANICPDC